MKKILFALFVGMLFLPALAQDLQPASADQAIKEYVNFWTGDSVDPMNHVVWKLYVFRLIPPHANQTNALEYIIAGLTPFPKTSYYVGLKINQLYNYAKPVAQRGGVIIVSGRITTRRNYSLTLPTKEVQIKMLTMDLDGGQNLPNEHFDPAATPTPGPGGQTIGPTYATPVAGTK